MEIGRGVSYAQEGGGIEKGVTRSARGRRRAGANIVAEAVDEIAARDMAGTTSAVAQPGQRSVEQDFAAQSGG